MNIKNVTELAAAKSFPDYYYTEDDYSIWVLANNQAVTVDANNIADANGYKWKRIYKLPASLNAYTTDPESTPYTGLATGLGATPYASVVDMNSLRVAYETLRAAFDDFKTKYTQAPQ